jgi:glycosyltransferase involved in cell wall biosynthesis
LAAGVRILVAADVHPDPNAGASGTEWQTVEVLRRLGHEVDTLWAGDLGRRIGHGNLHYLLELPRRYRSVIGARCDQTPYDVVHVNQGHCFLAALEHRKRRRHGVFVCRSHGLDDHMEIVLRPWREHFGIDARRSMLRRWVSNGLQHLLARHDRLAYRYADGVLVSASHDAEYLVASMGVATDRVAAIAQAPAAAFVDTAAVPMSESRRYRLLHVGGFAFWKGVHAVALSAGELLGRHERATLTWVCRAEEQAQARELLPSSVRERVAFLPWVAQDRLRDVYDSHGVFLAPSLFEGFGKVFLEALARGLCVVGTKTGGMKDIIRDGENGLHVGFNRPGDIVEGVSQLWRQPASMDRMSAAAAATARQYSWDRFGTELVAFYQRLIGLQRSTHAA